MPMYIFEKADIMHLDYPDHRFDAVVAANVIHLLDEPYEALHELEQGMPPGRKNHYSDIYEPY
ncbi:MAG: class I SAM-dependent methyltransferase [Clostridiales bacterium]|nr:MAG: class I SAM-dependent methyltransferase [Clostridiales bacterium]